MHLDLYQIRASRLLGYFFLDLFLLQLEPEAAALGIFVITYAVCDAPHEVALLEGLRLLHECLRAASVEIREYSGALVHIGDLLGERLLERVGLDLEDEALL